jgi:hypothetical protein
MCVCMSLDSIGDAQVEVYFPPGQLEPVTVANDCRLFSCRDCGALWEQVPSAPYWCTPSAPSRRRDPHPGHAESPLNQGYVLQRWLHSADQWRDRILGHMRQRQSTLQSEIAQLLADDYVVIEREDGGMRVLLERSIPKRRIWGHEGRERLLVGVDLVGRLYYEGNGQRWGEGCGESWEV